ncbi:MAG TPA: hypothetical protein VJN89_06785 [Candidatus Acidoferrum sp.]|nr:hypothetical protein [Candidatus Acidoferrum sp.]
MPPKLKTTVWTRLDPEHDSHRRLTCITTPMVAFGEASLQAGGGLLITVPIVPFGGFQNPKKQLFAQPVKINDRNARRVALQAFVSAVPKANLATGDPFHIQQ